MKTKIKIKYTNEERKLAKDAGVQVEDLYKSFAFSQNVEIDDGEVINFTHDELCNLGCKYLRTKNYNFVDKEITNMSGQFPDIYAIGSIKTAMIEVKISRSDFLADKKKAHAESKVGDKIYYLVPKDLIQPEEVPEPWGLLYAVGNTAKDIRVIKKPSENINVCKYSEAIIMAWIIKQAKVKRLDGNNELSTKIISEQKETIQQLREKYKENFLELERLKGVKNE